MTNNEQTATGVN